MNALFAVLLLSLTVAPTPPVPAVLRDRVQAYLGTIDTPIPASQWKALGEGGVVVLEEIARSPSALPTRRARAVSAAGLIGGARAVTLARDLLTSPAAPSVVRAASAGALAQLDPSDQTVRALQGALSADPSLSVRRAAAEALVTVAPAQCVALQKRIEAEPRAHRPAFAHALSRCPNPTK